jgi:hypothetical protein
MNRGATARGRFKAGPAAEIPPQLVQIPPSQSGKGDDGGLDGQRKQQKGRGRKEESSAEAENVMPVPLRVQGYGGQQEGKGVAGGGKQSEKKSNRRGRERERERERQDEGKPLSEWTTEEVCSWMGEVMVGEGVSHEVFQRYSANMAANEVRGVHMLR